MEPNARVGQASPLPILKASTSNVEDAGGAQPSLSDSWSTMGSWRPGSRSSPGSSGFSHGLSDSGFLDTPRPRSARELDPTPEEPAQSLADSGFLEEPPSPDLLPRPASRSSLIPTLKELKSSDGTLRGNVMSTITGTIIAALSVLPRVHKPRFPNDPAYELDAAAQLANALASVCVARDGDAHAVALADDENLINLYHAEDSLPSNTPGVTTNSEHTTDRRRVLDEHLASVCELLRDLYDNRSSEESSDLAETQLVELLYSRSLPALRTRFERSVDSVLSGLHSIVDRSFAHEDILRHPQPWRFCGLISETEWDLLKETHARLSSVKDLFARPAVDITPSDLHTLHCDLLAVYLDWFYPETRKNDESQSYFLNHLDRILQFSLAQYLRDIVWLAQAALHLLLAVKTPSLSPLFAKPWRVIFVDNQRRPFLANLDHDEIANRISCLYLGDDLKINITEARKRDWAAFVLEPLQCCLDAEHSICTRADTHCECTLLAYIDEKQPRGLVRFVGLSQASCLACWDQFAAYNAYMENLPRTVAGATVADSFFSPWRQIHTRATDTRVQCPWVAPEMRSDRRGVVSLYTQTALLSDLELAYTRKRGSARRAQIPAHGKDMDDDVDTDDDSDLDLTALFPIGEETMPLFTRA